jgi:hypothetical protein
MNGGTLVLYVVFLDFLFSILWHQAAKALCKYPPFISVNLAIHPLTPLTSPHCVTIHEEKDGQERKSKTIGNPQRLTNKQAILEHQRRCHLSSLPSCVHEIESESIRGR